MIKFIYTISAMIYYLLEKIDQKIGELVAKNNFGGVFPWASNYDSIENNNSLIKWLYI